jgi:proteasome assembly chaperone (PAC2) family protein
VELIRRSELPALQRPVLVAAFEGWNDAGEVASGTALLLHGELGAETFATIDPEPFFDFQLTRPQVHFTEDGTRAVRWPTNEFSWARAPGHDVVVLQGTEPNLRWPSFVTGIRELVDELGVELVITLGALQVDTPHTRPVPVTGSATSADVAERLALRSTRYEGPTGIVGVLHAACVQAGVPALSLWAGVPHYLAATPYLAGVLALAERLELLLGVGLPLDRLADESGTQQDDIATVVAADPDLAEYVSDLEDSDEEPDVLPPTGMSGEQLAEELERYLRDRD